MYSTGCIDVSFYFPVHCIYSRFSKWRPSAILDFKIVSIWNGTMFGDLDWPLNALRGLSVIAEFHVGILKK